MTDAVAWLNEFSLSVDEAQNVTFGAGADTGAAADASERIDFRMQGRRLQKAGVGGRSLGRPTSRFGTRAGADVESPNKPDGSGVNGKFGIQTHRTRSSDVRPGRRKTGPCELSSTASRVGSDQRSCNRKDRPRSLCGMTGRKS